jgi:hypothetical protein
MIHNLWPTKVVIETLPLEECMIILNSHVSNSTKDWEDIVEKRFENLLLDIVNSYYGGKHEICEGWIRTLSTKDHNDFELHSDSHYGGQLVAVFQISGDDESGGELVLYDPSWNNPQWVSDTKNRNSNTFTVPFTSATGSAVTGLTGPKVSKYVNYTAYARTVATPQEFWTVSLSLEEV